MKHGTFPGIGEGINRKNVGRYRRVLMMPKDYIFTLQDVGAIVGVWDNVAGQGPMVSPIYTIPREGEVNIPLWSVIEVVCGYNNPNTITIVPDTGVTVFVAGSESSKNSIILNSTTHYYSAFTTATARILKVDHDVWWLTGTGIEWT